MYISETIFWFRIAKHATSAQKCGLVMYILETKLVPFPHFSLTDLHDM